MAGFTAEQVEEVRMVIRMLPVFLTTILYWTMYAQVRPHCAHACPHCMRMCPGSETAYCACQGVDKSVAAVPLFTLAWIHAISRKGKACGEQCLPAYAINQEADTCAQRLRRLLVEIKK